MAIQHSIASQLEFEKLYSQSKAQFEKALLTLSSAAIGVIITVYHNGPIPHIQKIALWLFLISILLTLFGIFCYHFQTEYLRILFNTKKKSDQANVIDRITRMNFWIYYSLIYSCSSFFVGMFVTVLGFTI